VVEDLAQGDGLLAVGRELRPQLGHRGVVAEQPALGQPVDDGAGRGLADGVVVEHGAGVDRPPGGRVGHPGDDVHHLLAVLVDGHLDAPLGARGDQLVDDLLDLLLELAHGRQRSAPRCQVGSRAR
jgi:hypothetical protein